MMAGAAWIWVVAGLGLGMLEVILPGYVFAGFALAAVATGGLVWVGGPGLGLPFALAVFAVLSVACWLGLRRLFGNNRGDVKRWDRDINDN